MEACPERSLRVDLALAGVDHLRQATRHIEGVVGRGNADGLADASPDAVVEGDLESSWSLWS